MGWNRVDSCDGQRWCNTESCGSLIFNAWFNDDDHTARQHDAGKH